MKPYNNKHIRYNLRLYRFKFFTKIIKTFLKNQFLVEDAFCFKIKNIEKWYMYSFMNFWKLFRLFFFRGFMYDMEYKSLGDSFSRLANVCFIYNPFYMLEFFVKLKPREAVESRFLIFLKILLIYHIKRDYFFEQKAFQHNELMEINDKMSFLLSFTKGEKYNMFGERSTFYERIFPSIENISSVKYDFNVARALYNLFANYRLNSNQLSYLSRKPSLAKRFRQNATIFYYFNVWKTAYKSRERLQKYLKYFSYKENFPKKMHSIFGFKSLIFRNYGLWLDFDKKDDHEEPAVFKKEQQETFELEDQITEYISLKRKGELEFGDYIDYNKFRFYKKRKKFKFDKKNKKYPRKKKAIIHLDSSRSNYFVTLTDLSYKPIHSVTSGKFTQSTTKNRKAKKSSTAIYFLLKYLFIFMKAHKINSIILEVRKRFDPLFYQCFNFLKYKKIQISKVYVTRKMPHHKGLRKRKLRRI